MRKNLGPNTTYFPMPVAVLGTYDKEGKPNAMVAAWTGIYDSNQVYVCISTEHKTIKNLKEGSDVTIAFATKETIVEADYLGIKSGNSESDKINKCGLTVTKSTKVNAPLINEFPLILECKVNKLSHDKNDETTYAIFDIVDISVDESVLDEKGKVDSSKIHLVTYDSISHEYKEIGGSVAKAFEAGRKYF